MIKKIVILGAGRYAEVLLNVIASPEERERGIEVVATHRRAERRAEVEEKYDIQVLADNREACRDADMIYPLVRPEQMADLMEEIGPCIKEDQIFAVGAAAIPLTFYRKYLPANCALAWVFPPPFITTRAGYLAINPEPGINAQKLDELKEYWGRFCDQVLIVGDGALDSFTVLHACGQFFLYPIIKAMIAYGESNGFTREDAQAISLGTLRCTAQALSEIECSQEALEAKLDHARVPGNMTNAGLQVLDAVAVEDTFARCFAAAHHQAEINRPR